ncbi:MAG: YecA family protein, partial [Gammaproteobacteria bacterium]
MNKPTFSTELQALQSMDISELMALLTTQEDRLSRNVVDECIRRGENIVPKLRALLENETYWSEEVSAGQWWALLHAIMILGAIPGQATAEALLLGFQRIQNHQDEALWDWFAGYWPALFRNKREYVRTQLEKIAADEKLDWYPRIQALDCLIEAAHARGPAHLEDCLDWIQALIRTSWSDHYFCGLAGNILLDFPRQRHREMLESLGDRLQQKISIAPPFTRKDVDSALSRGKDQPEWERFANPWQFYDEQAIRDRQERWAREAAEKQAAEEKARQPLVREAPKVGRNDPCPCGSGKKYKKCCLTKAQEKPADLTWRRLRRAIEGLPPRILAFATEHCGRAALEEAWEAFVLFEDDSFHPEHPLITVFMPWFFYHWQPLWGETGIAPGSLQPGQTIAAAFLDSRQGSRLPPLARRYLEQAIAMPFSFFDILANRPGQGFEMRDIFTGETLQITEHSASQTLRPHDIILAMPVCLDGLAAVLESCAPIAIPPAHKGEVLGLRKLLQGAADPVSRETL